MNTTLPGFDIDEETVADLLAGKRRAVWVPRGLTCPRCHGVRRPADLDSLILPFGPLVADVVHCESRDGLHLLHVGLVGYPPFLSMDLPRPVASLKNSRVLAWRKMVKPGQRVRMVPRSIKSEKQDADLDMVKRHAEVALARSGGSPFGPDDAIRIEVDHMIEDDTLRVRAVKVGTLPPAHGRHGRRGTKRDVHGLIEAIADGLQGVWFEDDRQVDAAAQTRIR